MTGEAGMLTDERLTYEREMRIRVLLTLRDYRDSLQLASDGQSNARVLLAEVDHLRSERDALAARVAAAEGALNEARDVLDPFVMGDPSAVDQVNQAYRIVARALAARSPRPGHGGRAVMSEQPMPARHPMYDEMERLYGKAGCLLSGPGRGDCLHFVGLPAVLDQSTTDCYGRPIGWCYPCWADHLIVDREATIAAERARADAAEAALADLKSELERGAALLAVADRMAAELKDARDLIHHEFGGGGDCDGRGCSGYCEGPGEALAAYHALRPQPAPTTTQEASDDD